MQFVLSFRKLSAPLDGILNFELLRNACGGGPIIEIRRTVALTRLSQRRLRRPNRPVMGNSLLSTIAIGKTAQDLSIVVVGVLNCTRVSELA